MGLKPTAQENLNLERRLSYHIVAIKNGNETFLDFIKNGVPLTREALSEEFNDILDELFPEG